MRQSSRPGRIAVLAAVSALVTLVAAAPAAADTSTTLWVGAKSSSVAQGLGSDSAGKIVYLPVVNQYGVTATGVTVTVDASPAAGVLQVEPGVAGCSVTGGTISCVRPDLGGNATDETMAVIVRVAAGVPVGTVGSLTVTADAANAQSPYTISVDLTVAPSGPDLEAGDLDFAPAQPGGTVTVRPSVGDFGDQPVTGVTVRIQLSSGYFTLPDGTPGCVPDPADSYQAVCTYPDVTLTPGGGFQQLPAIPLAVSPQAAGPKLVTAQYVVAPLSGADADSTDDWAHLWVSIGASHADLAAIGAFGSGHQGSTMPIRIGVRNNGPSDTDSRADSSPGTIVITAPRGTVFSGVPADTNGDCAVAVNGQPDPSQPFAPGHQSYWCVLGGGTTGGLLRAGASQYFTFQLTIQQRIFGGGGTIVVQPNTQIATDPDSGNDTAPITVVFHR